MKMSKINAKYLLSVTICFLSLSSVSSAQCNAYGSFTLKHGFGVGFQNGRYMNGDTISRDKYIGGITNYKLLVAYKEENNRVVRYEYYPESGNLRSRAEVEQVVSIDTTVEDEKIKYLTHLLDVPNGDYVEYNDSKYNRLKQSGVASEYRKIGSWEEYDLRGHKEVINYVNGYPDGEYKSYYFSMKDSTYTLKQIGNYQYRKKTGHPSESVRGSTIQKRDSYYKKLITSGWGRNEWHENML